MTEKKQTENKVATLDVLYTNCYDKVAKVLRESKLSPILAASVLDTIKIDILINHVIKGDSKIEANTPEEKKDD